MCSASVSDVRTSTLGNSLNGFNLTLSDVKMLVLVQGLDRAGHWSVMGETGGGRDWENCDLSVLDGKSGGKLKGSGEEGSGII